MCRERCRGPRSAGASGVQVIHSGTWTSWMWACSNSALGRPSMCAGTSRAGSRPPGRCRPRPRPCSRGTARGDRRSGPAGSYDDRMAGNSPQKPARPGRPSDAMAQNPRIHPSLGRLDEDAAEAADLPGAVPLLDGPGEEEEHAGDEAVGHHAEDGGVDAVGGQGGDAEHHEAHVGHRGEGDQPFHVGLGQAAQGAVDDPDHGQAADPRGPGDGRVRQDRDGDADEAVGAELQQDGGQDDRADRGRLGVGVGQPGVERETSAP